MATEIIREIVSELRQQRLRAASAAELVRYLQVLNLNESSVRQYMTEAFCLTNPPNIYLIRRDRSGAFLDSALEGAFGPPIDNARDVWTVAGPYPDLLRRRDRHAFKEIAREMDLIVFVRAASASAELYIGRKGFRPRPPLLEGTTRSTEPNAGLIAADPEDADIVRRLQQTEQPRTYSVYKRQLESNGFEIGSPAEGYVIRDRAGTAFYPGYCLDGVYSASSGMNAWTHADGERIRAALNRRLGEEFVQCGPYDLWDQRNLNEAGIWSGPRFPVLMFHADGTAYVIPNAAHMAAAYSFRKINPEPQSASSSSSTIAGSK